MDSTFTVDNIKCGGCAKSIENKLLKEEGIDNVQVDVENGIVNVNGGEHDPKQIAEVLRTLGYPERDSVEGFDALKAKAKSYVSCAIGRMDK